MSDLLIKGLDAPKKCNGCCMNFIGHCMANKGLYVGRDNLEYNSKPDWCPATNIQPHGRLVDADALVKKSYEIKSSVGRYSRVVHIEDVKNADTIIPASGGADNG